MPPGPGPQRPGARPPSARGGVQGAAPPKAAGNAPPRKASSCVAQVEQLRKQREERRAKAEATKQNKEKEQQLYDGADVDFVRMIKQYREQVPPPRPFIQNSEVLWVGVRKRPQSQKEIATRELDCLTVSNPGMVVSECRRKFDGITKWLDNHDFQFDAAFDVHQPTGDVYEVALVPLVAHVVRNKGIGTVFAYGQTGSGKTYTMTGVQSLLAQGIFRHLEDSGAHDVDVVVSFYEMYGGRFYDLLNRRQRLQLFEDGKQEMVIQGLTEKPCVSCQELDDMMVFANSARSTHATASNDVSSRSHAICVISLRDQSGTLCGKLTLVDLAGSERAIDYKSHNRQRRLEGSEINKSLLALKECIRAMGASSPYIPFRASKLTLVLRECFTSPRSLTAMIACVNPSQHSADHTLNTLRYADRLKVQQKAAGQQRDAVPVSLGQLGNEGGSPGKQEARLRQAAGGYEPRDGRGARAPESRNLPEPEASYDEQSFPSDGCSPLRDEELEDYERMLPPGRWEDDEDPEVAAATLTPPRPGQRAPWAGGSPPPISTSVPDVPEHSSPDNLARISRADVDYLNQTIRLNNGRGMEDNMDLAHTTVVDDVYQAEEAIVAAHMAALREDAQLLHEEGDLLEEVSGQVDYDIDAYIARVEQIVSRKMEVYQNLTKNIDAFKQQLQKEDQLCAQRHSSPSVSP
mmetsp:Transcript_125153/g.286766  ORF Transcript_125153/g.286766 Transcript_125153/m.286766 type:complete len:690 (-) Transcript_125153:66-2135(-)